MWILSGLLPHVYDNQIEGDLTRGKIALLENLAHRLIEDPEAVNEKVISVPSLWFVSGQLSFWREDQ